MQEQKCRAVLASLSAGAQRLFPFVPRQEEWPIHRIISQMHRAGHPMQPDRVQAYMCELREAKLVREYNKNVWRAIEVRPEKPKVTISIDRSSYTDEPEPQIQENQTVPTDTLTLISNEAARLRATAAELEASAKRLDDLALQIEQQRGVDAEKAAKFEKLQALLK